MTLHIDRKAVGLECFFADHSDIFRGISDLDYENAERRLNEEFFSVRLPVATAVRSAFLRLADDERSHASELFPPEILPYFKKGYLELLQRDAALPFIKWLSQLQLKNKLNYDERISNLAATARRLDMYSRSFVENFLSKLSQRTVFLREGDDLVLSCAPRDWGKARVVFSQCRGDIPAMPLPGYTLCAELVPIEHGYEAAFLIDTHFSEDELSERLLNDDGWTQLSFSCSDIRVEAELYDYGARLHNRGTARNELIEKACEILISKAELMGKAWLSDLESEMLPFAYLINGASMPLKDSSVSQDICDAVMLKALDDRWAMRRLSTLLEENGCESAAYILDQAQRYCYENDPENALRGADGFYVVLDELLQDGQARRFYQVMSDKCIAMSKSDREPMLAGAEKRAMEALKASAEPCLLSLGFGGEFPNYRRKRKNKLEYISLALRENGERPVHGVVSYMASIAVGSTGAKRLKPGHAESISDFDGSTAFDCLAEAFTISKYGELACSCDGKCVKIDVFADADADFPLSNDESKDICEYIVYAQRQLRGRALPRRYRRFRTAQPFPPGAFGRAFLHCLPTAVVVLIAALCAYRLIPGLSDTIPLSPISSVLCASGVATAANALGALMCCRRKRKSIWSY